MKNLGATASYSLNLEEMYPHHFWNWNYLTGDWTLVHRTQALKSWCTLRLSGRYLLDYLILDEARLNFFLDSLLEDGPLASQWGLGFFDPGTRNLSRNSLWFTERLKVIDRCCSTKSSPKAYYWLSLGNQEGFTALLRGKIFLCPGCMAVYPLSYQRLIVPVLFSFLSFHLTEMGTPDFRNQRRI